MWQVSPSGPDAGPPPRPYEIWGSTAREVSERERAKGEERERAKGEERERAKGEERERSKG